MNIFDEHPFKVILDYGHNPAAIKAMVQLVEHLDTEGRRLVVLAAPGDRRDEDVREIARLCAGNLRPLRLPPRRRSRAVAGRTKSPRCYAPSSSRPASMRSVSR